jgi:hypothetical protein
LPAISAYSAGIATSTGFEITALRLLDCPSLADGFKRIDREIQRCGLTPHALVGLQLRSPGAFTFESFAKFNEKYRKLLLERSLVLGDINPISRTNVIPIDGAPFDPSIIVAFIVHPSKGVGGMDFIVSGTGEVDGELGPENIVARGDWSAKGMAAKVDCVLNILAARLVALSATGNSPTTINVYTAHEITNLSDAISLKLPSVARNGFAHWLTRPPIKEIEFEMDCSAFSNWCVI